MVGREKEELNMVNNVTCQFSSEVDIDVSSVGQMLRSGGKHVKMWNGKF